MLKVEKKTVLHNCSSVLMLEVYKSYVSSVLLIPFETACFDC